jgi:hypothetical protein
MSDSPGLTLCTKTGLSPETFMPYPEASLTTVTITTGPGGPGGGCCGGCSGGGGSSSEPEPVEPTDPADTGLEEDDPEERGRMAGWGTPLLLPACCTNVRPPPSAGAPRLLLLIVQPVSRIGIRMSHKMRNTTKYSHHWMTRVIIL